MVSGGKYRLLDTELAKLEERYRWCSYANATRDRELDVRHGSPRFDALEIFTGEFLEQTVMPNAAGRAGRSQLVAERRRRTPMSFAARISISRKLPTPA